MFLPGTEVCGQTQEKLKTQEVCGQFCFVSIPLNDGPIRTHFTRSDWAYDVRSRECVNARGKDTYLSIATYKNARKGRRRENVEAVQCCFLDLDGDATLDALKKRIKELGLPLPLILNTSPGHYQLKWYFRISIRYDEKGKPYKTWVLAQKALSKAFGDFKVDMKPLLDVTRLLRNEHAKGIYNCKHGEPFRVKVVEPGELTSLTELYGTLKAAGYIDKGYKPLRQSREALFRFFKTNPLWRGTQKRLSEITGIALRTLKLLLEEMRSRKLLDEKITGQGGASRAIIYRFKPVVMRVFQSIRHEGHREKNKSLKTFFEQVIENFKLKKIELGNRNNASFAAAIALKESSGGQITLEQAICELRPGFELSNSGDKSFTWAQFCKTVASGLRPDRTFRFNRNNLREWGLC